MEELGEKEKQLYYLDPDGTKKLVIEDIEDDTVTLFEVTSSDEVINVTLTLDKKNVGTVKLETAVKPRN